MASITIKDIPEDIHKKMKRIAFYEGRSLNKQIILLMKKAKEVK